MPDLTRLQGDLLALEQDTSLLDDRHYATRIQVLDTLDFLAQAFQACGPQPAARDGLQRVCTLRSDLAARNDALYQRLRQGIRSETFTRGQLRSILLENSRYPADAGPCYHWGREPADELAAGLFHSDRPPEPWTAPDPEMVHYESTPVSALLELVDRVPLTQADRFVDIGSGLGQVPLLIHLLTGVDALGLEVMPGFVAQASQETASLGIQQVRFCQGDARSADLGHGTVYFLFTPFRGQMLQTVLNRLHQEAVHRPLTLCSFGPCTGQIAGESWLTILEPEMDHEFRLAIFKSAGEPPRSPRNPG